MASYGAPSTPEAQSHNSAKGDESHSYSSPMPMVFENSRSRSPRQHYVWSEKALSIVRSTRIPKKDGALVAQQLQELTGYPEKPCWRLAERFGFRRPNARRVWSQEDVARIIELSETTCIREIARRFKPRRARFTLRSTTTT